MNLSAMIATAVAASVALGVLLWYLPVHKKVLGMSFSPRLAATWLVPLLDVAVTLYLVTGTWFGFGDGRIGIGMTMFNVSTAIGLSLASLIIRKIFRGRWQAQYQLAKKHGVRQRRTALAG